MGADARLRRRNLHQNETGIHLAHGHEPQPSHPQPGACQQPQGQDRAQALPPVDVAAKTSGEDFDPFPRPLVRCPAAFPQAPQPVQAVPDESRVEQGGEGFPDVQEEIHQDDDQGHKHLSLAALRRSRGIGDHEEGEQVEGRGAQSAQNQGLRRNVMTHDPGPQPQAGKEEAEKGHHQHAAPDAQAEE